MTREREINGSIKPAIPYLEYYLPYSDTPIVEWQWYSIVWGSHYIITSDFTEKTDGALYTDYVIIQTTGLYRIDFQLNVSDTEGKPSCMSRLLLNDVKVPYSVGYEQLSSTTNITLFTTITLYLKKDDTVMCEWATDSSTAFLGENSVFRLSYVPMGGFNNGEGGNIVQRGIRR
jgi:hypothetical protein